MKITLELLRKHHACHDAIIWLEEQDEIDPRILIDRAMRADHWDWINWLLVRLMSRQDRIEYAAFAAEEVLCIFEEKYPQDKRPRNAIRAARNFIRNPTKEAAAAAYAAANFADASAHIAYASNAAENFANTAYAAANFAANIAYVANAAADIAYAAYASYTTNATYATYTNSAIYYAFAAVDSTEIKKRIITKGVELLKL